MQVAHDEISGCYEVVERVDHAKPFVILTLPM